MTKMMITINGHGQSYCFKETQFILYKFYTNCTLDTDWVRSGAQNV